MDILDMAEAVGAIVERVRTPTIDWKQRALDAEDIADAATKEAEALDAKLSHVGNVLAECGAPTQKRAEPTRAIFITSAIDRAEWLKSKIAERGGLEGKHRSTIPEIFAIYDAALERADASRDTGAKLSSREVVHKAILAVVEHLQKERDALRLERDELIARVREVADDVLGLQASDEDPLALCFSIAAAYHAKRIQLASTSEVKP